MEFYSNEFDLNELNRNLSRDIPQFLIFFPKAIVQSKSRNTKQLRKIQNS